MALGIDACHLPGLAPGEVPEWETRRHGDDVVLRFPVLSPDAWRAALARVREAREAALAERPVREIVAAVDAAAARLANPADPLRRLAEGALPAVTGYSPAMIQLVLDRMAADWRAGALERLLAAELGDPRVLDAFVPAAAGAGARRRVRAFGPELAFHVFAGNVPGVAVTALVRALLVKAAVAGKLASGEPLLPVLFARALTEVDPALGACIALAYWPGGEHALEAVSFEAADAIVVYGGERAVDDVRRRAPVERRVVVYGPRLSCGIVGREALATASAGAVAAEVALAVATFDQQGCVSPHVVYVERGGDVAPAAFAETLAGALAGVERDLPRGRLSAAEAAAIHDARASAEFRSLAGEAVALHASRDTAYTVIYEEDPGFAVSCLNRVVRVKRVERAEDVAGLVAPYARYLQTIGVAGIGGARLDALAARLARAGACRVAPFSAMPWPPPEWHHDGGEPLRSLLRWMDLEG